MSPMTLGGIPLKQGLEPGAEARVEVEVDPSMFARLDGTIIHRLYGTAAMVGHMELAGRRVLEPYLEDGEEGVGFAVDVRHFRPAPEGARLRVRAEAIHVDGDRLVCRVEARWDDLLIGQGTFTQVVRPASELRDAEER